MFSFDAKKLFKIYASNDPSFFFLTFLFLTKKRKEISRHCINIKKTHGSGSLMIIQTLL